MAHHGLPGAIPMPYTGQEVPVPPMTSQEFDRELLRIAASMAESLEQIAKTLEAISKRYYGGA